MSDNALYSIRSPEKWIQIDELDTSRNSVANDAPLHFLKLSYQDRVQNGSIDRFTRRTYQINDESQLEDNSQSLHELSPLSEHITFHRCVIYRSGQIIECLNDDRIRTLQRDRQLEQQVSSDRITVELLIDDLRVGDIVDIQSTLTTHSGDHAVHGKYYHACNWLEWGVPIDDVLIRVVNDGPSPILIHRRNDDLDMTDTSTLSVGDINVLRVTDLPAIPAVHHLPNGYWSDVLICTSSATWREISSHLFRNNTEKAVYLDQLTPSQIADIGFNHWDNADSDGILQVIRFVQDSIRYRAESGGIHTHTPKQIEETLRRRMGDCKDKSALLVLLLKRLGIEAHMTLVNTRLQHDVQNLNPSPYWFDHMIVRFNFNNRFYLVDPTVQKQGGTLETLCVADYGYCLPITEAGSELIAIEQVAPELVLELSHEFDLQHQSIEECTLKVTRKYLSERADNMRFYIASRNKQELGERYRQYAMEMFNLNLSIVSPFQIVDDDRSANVVTTEEHYQLAQNDDKSLPENIAYSTNLYEDFKMPKRETHPVATGPECICRHEVRVIYQDTPSSMSDSFVEKNPFFEYWDKIETTGNTITSQICFTSLRKSISADEVNHCREVVMKVHNRCRTTLPLKLAGEKRSALESISIIAPTIVGVLTARSILDRGYEHPASLMGLATLAIWFVLLSTDNRVKTKIRQLIER